MACIRQTGCSRSALLINLIVNSSACSQLDEVKKDEERVKESNRTAVIQTGYEMSHSAGFDAWLRNQEVTP